MSMANIWDILFVKTNSSSNRISTVIVLLPFQTNETNRILIDLLSVQKEIFLYIGETNFIKHRVQTQGRIIQFRMLPIGILKTVYMRVEGTVKKKMIYKLHIACKERKVGKLVEREKEKGVNDAIQREHTRGAAKWTGASSGGKGEPWHDADDDDDDDDNDDARVGDGVSDGNGNELCRTAGRGEAWLLREQRRRATVFEG